VFKHTESSSGPLNAAGTCFIANLPTVMGLQPADTKNNRMELYSLSGSLDVE
jgi:hypothetical protein